MYPLRVALTLDKIEALAPDQASLTASRKLLKAAAWPTLTAGENLVWGECQGSGSTPYRVVVSEADAGYKCTCPSRKFPCKHSLALMWMRAEGKVAFAVAPVPEWVKDWLSRRRGPVAVAEKTTEDEVPKPSIRLAHAAAEEPGDPKDEARAAAARERNRVEREATILSGLADLDVWLNDQVERGMASFIAQSAKECRAIAERLVDAKASALATRLDALPSRLFSMREPMRPQAAVKELGQVHLIAEAYRRQSELPLSLTPDIRHAVGWTLTREALLSDATALRVSGTWCTIAVVSEVQPDRLRRIETWLWCEDDSSARVALLLDFVPVASGASASGGYVVGDRFEAEVVFYPSVLPLRAQILQRLGDTHSTNNNVIFPSTSLTESLASYNAALAQLPWLGTWPMTFRTAEVRRAGEALYLLDLDGDFALPLAESQATNALPLVRTGTMDGFGLWDGYRFTLCWTQTTMGRWVNA